MSHETTEKTVYDEYVSKHHGVDKTSLGEILRDYFDYLVQEKLNKQKLRSITWDAFDGEPVVRRSARQVVVNLSNLSFNSYAAISTKSFSMGDILEFGGAKQKNQPNIYLIRRIEVIFDFSENDESKIDKMDESLPDLIINIKVHPVFHKSTIEKFPEAKQGLAAIQKINPHYKLDKMGIICIFETGNRPINDPRLTFEQFLLNISNIYIQQHLIRRDNKVASIIQDLNECKSFNSLN